MVESAFKYDLSIPYFFLKKYFLGAFSYSFSSVWHWFLDFLTISLWSRERKKQNLT